MSITTPRPYEQLLRRTRDCEGLLLSGVMEEASRLVDEPDAYGFVDELTELMLRTRRDRRHAIAMMLANARTDYPLMALLVALGQLPAPLQNEVTAGLYRRPDVERLAVLAADIANDASACPS